MESIRKIIDTVTPSLAPPFADKNTRVGIRVLRELVCLLAVYRGVRWTRQGSPGFGIPLTVLGGAGAIGEAIRIRGGFRQVKSVDGPSDPGEQEPVQQRSPLADAVKRHEAFNLHAGELEVGSYPGSLATLVTKIAYKGTDLLGEGEVYYMFYSTKQPMGVDAEGDCFADPRFRRYLMVVLPNKAKLPHMEQKSGFQEHGWWELVFYVNTEKQIINTPWNFADNGQYMGSFKDPEALIAEVSKLAQVDLHPPGQDIINRILE